jgi:hypothetical protein
MFVVYTNYVHTKHVHHHLKYSLVLICLLCVFRIKIEHLMHDASLIMHNHLTFFIILHAFN